MPIVRYFCFIAEDSAEASALALRTACSASSLAEAASLLVSVE